MQTEPQNKPQDNKIWLALAIIFFVGFLALIYPVAAGLTQQLDDQVLQFVLSIRRAPLNTIIEGITNLGCAAAITCLCLILLAFDKTRMRYGVPVTVTALIAQAIKGIVKTAVARPRPDVIYFLVAQGGYSFPSGHAITSLPVYLLLAWLLWYYGKRPVPKILPADPEEGDLPETEKEQQLSPGARIILIVVCIFLGFAIGLSRIYLGVHWFTDVMGGWLAGAAVLCFMIWLIRKLGWDIGWISRWRSSRKAAGEGRNGQDAQGN